MWVMQCQGLIGMNRAANPEDMTGLYLAAYDPDAHDGAGEARWTGDPVEAIHFADAGEVHRLWTAVSTVRPVRADGRPNRPLTAYTIMALREEEAMPV